LTTASANRRIPASSVARVHSHASLPASLGSSVFEAVPREDFGLREESNTATTALRADGGSRPTLERKLELTWEGLLAAGVAGCPMCGGRMERAAASARCGDCGTTLA